MNKYYHCQPCVVPVALNFYEILFELIIYGIHINPNIINLTYKIKEAKLICLATDAMYLQELLDDEYQF